MKNLLLLLFLLLTTSALSLLRSRIRLRQAYLQCVSPLSDSKMGPKGTKRKASNSKEEPQNEAVETKVVKRAGSQVTIEHCKS